MAVKVTFDRLICDALRAIERLRAALQDYYDDKSDDWRDSHAGAEWDEKICTIDDLLATLEETMAE